VDGILVYIRSLDLMINKQKEQKKLEQITELLSEIVKRNAMAKIYSKKQSSANEKIYAI